MTNSGTDLAVGSLKYTYSSGAITVNEYSGTGCNSAYVKAQYPYTTGVCTPSFTTFHTQTNPYFPSPPSAPFFHSIMPMYSAGVTKPAGLGLTTVEYNNVDCTGIPVNFVSIPIETVVYNVSGGVASVVTFSCTSSTEFISGYPLVTTMNTVEGSFTYTSPIGCGNDFYNDNVVNTTSANAVTYCDFPPTSLPSTNPTPMPSTAQPTTAMPVKGLLSPKPTLSYPTATPLLCPAFNATNTNSDIQYYAACYIYACPSTILQISDCTCRGDQVCLFVLRLF